MTYSQFVQLFQNLASAHVDVFGFYRFNIMEITNKFRSGVQTPALMLEAPSINPQPGANKVANFLVRNVSFLILDFAGKPDDYNKQEQVLDKTEAIALDMAAWFVHQHNLKGGNLYALIDLGTMRIEKVGPIFDNMYGWNVLFDLKTKNPLCYNPSKFNFPEPEPTTGD